MFGGYQADSSCGWYPLIRSENGVTISAKKVKDLPLPHGECGPMPKRSQYATSKLGANNIFRNGSYAMSGGNDVTLKPAVIKEGRKCRVYLNFDPHLNELRNPFGPKLRNDTYAPTRAVLRDGKHSLVFLPNHAKQAKGKQKGQNDYAYFFIRSSCLQNSVAASPRLQKRLLQKAKDKKAREERMAKEAKKQAKRDKIKRKQDKLKKKENKLLAAAEKIKKKMAKVAKKAIKAAKKIKAKLTGKKGGKGKGGKGKGKGGKRDQPRGKDGRIKAQRDQPRGKDGRFKREQPRGKDGRFQKDRKRRDEPRPQQQQQQQKGAIPGVGGAIGGAI
jgi:hypothetical protein